MGILLGNRRVNIAFSDTEAPTVPTNLRRKSATTSSITVAWDASTDNVGVTAYQIRINSGTTYTTTSLIRTFTGLSENTKYNFDVRAGDAAGNWSDWSSVVQMATTWSGLSYTRVSGPGSYSYYRLSYTAAALDIFIGGCEFYSGTNGGGTKYPPSSASSYTTPAGYIWSEGYAYSSNYAGWKIADGLSYTAWWTLGSGLTAANNWVQGQFPSAVTIQSVKISISPAYTDTSIVYIQGSNNGSTWTNIGYFGNIVGNNYSYTLYTKNL